MLECEARLIGRFTLKEGGAAITAAKG